MGKIKYTWTAEQIASALIDCQSISTKYLVVPNCYWTGNETDLLIIERNLRIVDIEIKISRSDLKADLSKDKWWIRRPWSRYTHKRVALDQRRQWPDKVWKHYYAMPAGIWTDDLLPSIPEASGILLVGAHRGDIVKRSDGARVKVLRMAKPNRDAKPISVPDALDIARLANLRMWTAIRNSWRISGANPTNPGATNEYDRTDSDELAQ